MNTFVNFINTNTLYKIHSNPDHKSLRWYLAIKIGVQSTYMYEPILFGPIPSRRLGQSLGVNHIPYKCCSYSCIYCQIGRTAQTQIKRRSFCNAHTLHKKIVDRVQDIHSKGEAIDYITFVPDGEPTLEENLGEMLSMLKEIRIPTAVITNASLMWDAQVRDDLAKADLVSVKVDAIQLETWEKINRPHKDLMLDDILEGIRRFASVYTGTLITETMLVDNINDDKRKLELVAEFLSTISPASATISTPTRPPAENSVKPATQLAITRAHQIFENRGLNVQLTITPEGDSFTIAGELEEEILNITALHPLSKTKMLHILEKHHAAWDIVQKLIEDRKLKEVKFGEEFFYLRFFRKSN